LAATAIAAAGSAAVVLPGISTLQIIMASTKAKMGLAIVLAASATTPIVLQHQTNSQLRDENARLRAELANPPAVQSAAVDVSELERLRGEHNELLRLRGQVAQYRQQLANLPKTSVVAGRGPGKADDLEESEREEAKALLEKSPEIPMIQASEFRNMGYSTAENSFHTMNWATSRRDTNAALGAIGLEPAARARADDLFLKMPEAVQQRYGSVDALLMDWMMTHAEPPVAYRILAQSAQGENLATLTVQFQYPNFRVRENELSYYRDPTGAWRIAMPAGVMDKLPGVAESLMHGSTAPGSSGK
jgi:hypothetical protein